MKKITLKEITLQEWKSLNLQVSFKDGLNEIAGRNGVGKSSIRNAFTWLLTGMTTPESNKNADLFDNRHELSPDTPNATVKAVIDIDGQEYEIKRTAKCKWVKKRGTEQYEKASSDEYVTEIDGMTYSANDFDRWLNDNIAPTQHLPYMLNGEFFSYLVTEDKNKARKILESLVGEINWSDFSGDYSLISDDLSKYTAEQIKQRESSTIKSIDEDIIKADANIKVCEDALAVLKLTDWETLKKNCSEKKESIERIDRQILESSVANSPVMEERHRIETEIERLEREDASKANEYKREYDDKVYSIKNEIRRAEQTNIDIESEKRLRENKRESLQKSLSILELEVEQCDKMRENLLKQRDEVKSRVFDGDRCAYCGAKLQGERLQEAEEAFNRNKAAELEIIIARGRSNNETKVNKLQQIENIEEQLEVPVNEREKVNVDELKGRLATMQEMYVDWCSTSMHNEYMRRISELNAQMPEMPARQDNAELMAQKRTLMDEFEFMSAQYGRFGEIKENENKMVRLKEEKRLMGVEKAKHERLQMLVKSYERERADIVSRRINGLKYCDITMTRLQKDGSLVDDCIITNKLGVKYSTLNHGSRIQCDVDMQRLFCEHYKTMMPVFVDECGTLDLINRPYYNDTQVMHIFRDDCELCVR